MGIGSWLRNHPRGLERSYQATRRLFEWAAPFIRFIGYERADRWISAPEDLVKRIVFDCQICGQCILHSTGMTCPMTCPKNLRNGPCGGVRANGNCEVIPDMKCIWVEAFERSERMVTFKNEILLLQAPVNKQLEGSSAWVNMLSGKDKITPRGWTNPSQDYSPPK